jgi:hypothetical protein
MVAVAHLLYDEPDTAPGEALRWRAAFTEFEARFINAKTFRVRAVQ